MSNNDTNKSTKLTEDEMMQVKGGPAYIKIGDIKGEVAISAPTGIRVGRSSTNIRR